MTAAITTTSTTLEGQFLEISRELELAEQAEGLNNISLSPNINSNSLTVTATVPITFSGTGNQLSIAASEYIGVT